MIGSIPLCEFGVLQKHMCRAAHSHVVWQGHKLVIKLESIQFLYQVLERKKSVCGGQCEKKYVFPFTLIFS
jgi:hypothetical protein